MDIAQLGFSVNATAIEAATKSLNEMTAAAARAEKASKMGSARGSDRVTERAERQAASVRKVSRAYDSVGVSGRRAMTTIAASTRKTAAEVGYLRSQLRGIGEVFKHAIGGLIAFGAVAAMTEFARSIVDANREMQRMLNTLNSATGSMAQARSEFTFLADLADKLGTDLQGSADGYARLAISATAAGVSTAALHKAFTGLSEGFAATGRSGDEMNRFLVQLEQGLSQGTLHMRDLRAMAQSFPAAFELAGEAAKAMGHSLEWFLKNGGLPAKEFFLTFSEIVHTKFAGAAKEAADTLVGQLHRISNALFEAKTGGKVLQPLTDAFRDLANELQSAQGQKALQNLVANIVTGFKAALNAVVAVVNVLPELILLAKLFATIIITRWAVGAVAGIGGVGRAIKAVTASMAALNAMSIGGWAARVGVAMRSAGVSVRALKIAFIGMKGAIVGTLYVTGAAIVGWKIGSYLRDKFRIVADAGDYLASYFVTLMELIKAVFHNGFKALAAWIVIAIQGIRDRVADAIEGFSQLAKFSVAGVDVDFTYGQSDKLKKLAESIRGTGLAGKEAAKDVATFGNAWSSAIKNGQDALKSMQDATAVEFGGGRRTSGGAGFAAHVLPHGKDMTAASSGTSSMTAADRLLQSINKRITANKTLVKAMADSDYQQTKLAQSDKDKLALDKLVKDGLVKLNSAMYKSIQLAIQKEKATDAAVAKGKAHAQALKDQAQALERVNKIGSIAGAKAGAINDNILNNGLALGRGRSSTRSVTEAAATKTQLDEATKGLANTKDATAARMRAVASVKALTQALAGQAIQQGILNTMQQALDSRDPYAQQERQINLAQQYTGYIQSQIQAMEALRDANSSAFDPKKLKEWQDELKTSQKAVGIMKTQLMGIKIEDAANNVAAGLKSLQSLSEQGSKSYKEMQVAIDAANIAAAIGAILNQGMGDPYTAFARMAAMAALVATFVGDVGSVGAGYNGPETAANRQANQGTGTVLGDLTKQSQSIANAVKITSDSTSKLVGINTGMLNALTSLQNGLSGAGVALARGQSSVVFPGFKKDVNPLNNIIDSINPIGDPLTSAVNNFLFGGKQSLVDSGIKIVGGALNDLLNQVVVGAYQTIHKSGGLFGHSKTYDVTQSVSSDVSKQFGLVLKAITDSVTQAAIALGVPLTDIQNKIAEFRVATTHLSLKGLDAEDRQKAIAAVFSKIFDNLAAAVVPFVKEFQKVGEGMAETLVRVATDVQIMQRAVKTLGFAIRTSDPKKFAEVSVALVELMGGADQFIQGMNSFISDFAPDAVKLKQAHDQLTAALKQVGLALPDTRTGMWKLMQSLDATTDSGRQQIATLLRLADVSDQYYSMLEQGVDTVAKKAQDLATKLYGALGGSLDAINKKLDELRGKTQSALGVALGANSPLSAQEQLNLALKGLHSGLTTVSQVLQIGKQLYRGADYRKLYEQVMAGQGMGAGGVGDIGAAVDQYNSLYAKQQQLKKQQEAMDRFNNAKQLASYVVQMAQNKGESYKDVATGLGFSLNSLGKDLGVTSIIGYLDKLRLEGAGTGKEQVAAINNLNNTANNQLTTLKSIDQRLRNIENGTTQTATNTGKQVQNSNRQSLRQRAAGSRTVPA